MIPPPLAVFVSEGLGVSGGVLTFLNRYGIMLLMHCPHCSHEIDDQDLARYLAAKGGAKGGRSTSKAKQRASRENGKKGGRPRKQKTE